MLCQTPCFKFYILIILFEAFCQARSLSFAKATESAHQSAVVVGGGPVGLATALMLKDLQYHVTVLEQSQGSDIYDAAKAFLFSINARGLRWFDAFPSAKAKLYKQGVLLPIGQRTVQYVPPLDKPNATLPPPKTFGISPAQKKQSSSSQPLKSSVWIPRHKTVQLLAECRAQEKIQIKYSTSFKSIEQHPDGLCVKCEDGSQYVGQLVVGADGYQSRVRKYLESPQHEYLQYKSRHFKVKAYKSPATGLKFKALQIPANFAILNGTSLVQTQPAMICIIPGIFRQPQQVLILGLSPTKSTTHVRPANTVTRPDHVLWKATTAKHAKDWFTLAFPQINWNMLDEKEWERFAKAPGTVRCSAQVSLPAPVTHHTYFVVFKQEFPLCQYSPRSVATMRDLDAGVVLVGDACHAFPPDIGQGVNAGLEDVMALNRTLSHCHIVTNKKLEKTDLRQALQRYQANRKNEHQALIHLARVGAPYQYRQPWYRDRVGRFFWTCNALLRMVLHKIFKVSPPLAIRLAQNSNLTYRQVMRRANALTFLLSALLLIAPAYAWFIH